MTSHCATCIANCAPTGLPAPTLTAQLSLDGLDEDGAATNEIVRARAVLDLATALDVDLDERGATKLLTDVELPLIGVLAGLEQVGIATDLDVLADLSSELGACSQGCRTGRLRRRRP